MDHHKKLALNGIHMKPIEWLLVVAEMRMVRLALSLSIEFTPLYVAEATWEQNQCGNAHSIRSFMQACLHGGCECILRPQMLLSFKSKQSMRSVQAVTMPTLQSLQCEVVDVTRFADLTSDDAVDDKIL